ncbi:DUF4270 family protein [Bacteroides acidifaciens]|uniref:DUF4270 family protein n=1 Tax=Bacteroides acidifaciens TaxID=85831 RepID=UPI003015097B
MLKASASAAAIAAITLAASIFTSCEDTPNVGSSLVENSSQIMVFDDFTITGKTVDNPSVQTRNTTQVLGTITADGYGTFSSDFVTEFLPASKIDTHGITLDQVDNLVDSLKIRFYVPVGSTVGDTIAPMGLELYQLGSKLSTPINSNTPVNTEGLKLLAKKVYVCNALGESDSIKKLSYRPIDVKIDDNGKLARQLFRLYLTKPEVFQMPSLFAQNFPGIYVRTSYGSGRVVGISTTIMTMYYHTFGTDEEGKQITHRHEGAYFAVTPEVILNNMIKYTPDQKLKGRLDAGENILVAPVGYDMEIKFPIEEVISKYKENAGNLSVINNLSLDLPAVAIENEYDINPPTNILMVLTKDKEKFFRLSELTDDETSFYATYDSENKRYRFAGLRPYLLKMLEKHNAGTLTPDDYTFTLTPVSVIMETNTNDYYGTGTSYLSAINPYIGNPVMVKLDLDKAAVNFTFSKQNVN